MFKPWHSLVFAAAFFALTALVSWLFPSAVLLGDLKVRFPDPAKVFTEPHTPEKANAAIARIEKLDTMAAEVPVEREIAASDTSGTRAQVRDSTRLITSIQTNGGNPLLAFFESLDAIKTTKSQVRILHYGDSQIEGDRITDYLRLKLQGRFGGSGPGLVSALPVSQSVVNRINTSAGWDRYTTYTAKDKRVAHNNYGVMAGFARFMPYVQLTDTSSVRTASLQIITNKGGGANARLYQRLRLFYGGARQKVWCEMHDGPVLSGADSLLAGGVLNFRDFEPAAGSFDHTFTFRGKDSPDLYAISLETPTGVMVDNIGLRGSSGTFFHQINGTQLKEFFKVLHTRLIILQFGGNAMPAVKDAAGAAAYGSYVRYQLSVIKKLAPGVSILFIGPSDMSTKNGTTYETMPYLEDVRNAIRKAVLDNGCAFFDIYDCMGGRNSMPVWVEQKLAATDYIHFSPQGARKIAILLYTALMNEYNDHVQRGKK